MFKGRPRPVHVHVKLTTLHYHSVGMTTPNSLYIVLVLCTIFVVVRVGIHHGRDPEYDIDALAVAPVHLKGSTVCTEHCSSLDNKK